MRYQYTFHVIRDLDLLQERLEEHNIKHVGLRTGVQEQSQLAYTDVYFSKPLTSAELERVKSIVYENIIH